MWVAAPTAQASEPGMRTGETGLRIEGQGRETRSVYGAGSTERPRSTLGSPRPGRDRIALGFSAVERKPTPIQRGNGEAGEPGSNPSPGEDWTWRLLRRRGAQLAIRSPDG